MTLPQAARPRLVDFHCHLDLYPDHVALIRECDRERVATLAVTTTPKAWPRNRDLAQASTHVRVALGLHPQLVAEREAELPLFERYLGEARYIGEVGLDAGPAGGLLRPAHTVADDIEAGCPSDCARSREPSSEVRARRAQLRRSRV